MGDVISDNVWVGTTFVEKGTRREDVPTDVVGMVGSHLWTQEEARSNVSASGEALTGLRDNVWIDGVLYEKGTVPPASVIPKVGDHLWVDGYTPPAAAEPVIPAPDPVADPPVQPEVPRVILKSEDSIEDELALEEPTPDFGSPDPEAEAKAEDDGPEAPADVQVPAKGGPGSAKSAWVEYARSKGVSIEPGASREDIIRDLEDAGIPTE